ncbi:MAG: MBL fold metallo-hydrolase [Deltaproteobacteria bacterium]|nr:MAG: MBL fold metallo-hydrolase [Deltaproteobacteria bacterium]
MKKRIILIFAGGIIIGVIMTITVSCLSWRSPALVVREPETPEEARIEYTPPPKPRFSVEFLSKYMPILKTLILPRIEKVTDDIYVALGYALGNVTMIITGEGVVIIDTTESKEAAEEVLKKFRKITDKPIRYIIYTHFHPDHILGTEVFYSEGVEVIATSEFVKWAQSPDRGMGSKYFRRVIATLGGEAEKGYGFSLPVESPYRGQFEDAEVVMPTITFQGKHSFTLGGKRFELFQTSGETEDHLAVWIPDERALHIGDLYYMSFPCLTGLMLEARPVIGWINSLTRFIGMRPDHLLLGHTKTLKGAGLIKEHLTNYREAIRFVYDETMRYIAAGRPVHQATAEIRLPDHLSDLPYLEGLYCRVDWAVRGLYHDYTGWYDGRGTDLISIPPEYRARELVGLSGGADKILARAIELQKNDEHQLCAGLCDVVIAANPGDRLAHIIKAHSMEHLAFGSNNLICIGTYRSAYSIHTKAAAEIE